MNNLDEINSRIKTLSKAIQSDPDKWVLYRDRGNAYYNRGGLLHSNEDYSRAIEDYTKAIELNPDNWEIYRDRGNAYNNRGTLLHSNEDYSRAIEDFTKAIELNPDNWEIYQDRGNAYYNRGILLDNAEDYSLAIEDHTEAIELNPDNWEIYFERGLTYSTRGAFLHSIEDYYLAIVDYTKAIDLNPDNWEIYFERGKLNLYCGILLHGKENYSNAIDDLTKAIKLNPNNWEIYHNRGIAYNNRGVVVDSTEDFSLAIVDYTKAIGLNPNNWEIYNYRGMAYYHRGNSTEDCSHAVDDLTKAIKLNPNNWEIYHNRGKAYYGRGVVLQSTEDCILAIKDFTKAIKLNPDNWEIYFRRGRAYRSISKHTECIEDINASLYWASKHKDKLEPALDTIELVYSTEPFNHWSWLICLVETNQFSSGLMAKYIDLQAQLYDFLLVFKYLEYSQTELTSPNSDYLRIIPILIYHLRGCVTTYRLFDERLDDEDAYQLTAQEYYYYIRSAFHFCMECKQEMGTVSIIDNAINKLSARTGLNEEDYYYLGLIYYILILEFGVEGSDKKALEEEALSCFNRSKGFIWSRAMVELIEHDTYSDEIKGYIQEHCNLQREIDIKPLLSGNASEFLHQFDDYLHFQEITGIWPYLVSSVEYNEPIWEVFTLNECDSETLKNKLQKKSVDEIFQKVVEEKKEEGIQELTQEETEEIENDNTLSIFKSLSDKKKLISLFLEVTISSDRKNKDALFEKLRRYIYRDGKITIDEYLLLGYYYDTFKGDMIGTNLLGDTASMVSEIIKAALIVPVVLGALASIFTAHLAERNGLNLKSSLKNQYASYDNFMEFTKNISQYKQFVGGTNDYEVILL